MADNANVGTITYKVAMDAKSAKKELGSLSDKLKGVKTALKAVGGGVFLKFVKDLGPKIEELTEKQAAYITSLNMFRNTMKDTTGALSDFVEKAEELTGLDSKQVMDFMTGIQRIGEGYGLASDEVQKMSQNLAQLAGDLTTLGFSYEETTTKLKAGFRGAIKPIAELGVAIDQNSLQELAYERGINQRVSTMTKAQKTELIYLQIMKQTANIQGNLSQAMITPQMAMNKFRATMERLARAVGSIFIPIMMKIIPVIEAIAKVLTKAAQWIASLFGFKIEDYSFSAGNLADISDGIEDIGDSAAGTTKELKKMLMPFDELNNVSFDTGGSGSGSTGIGGSLGLDMPEIYDFFGGLEESNIDRIAKEITDNLPLIADAIALFFLALGNTKAAAAIELINGLTQIIDGIKDIVENGPNFDNVTKIIEGLGRVGFAIGIMTGNWKLAIGGLALSWVVEAIKEIVRCWDAIRQGNWDDVDKAKLVLGVIGALALIGIALSKLGVFNKIKNPFKKATTTIEETATGTSKLTGTLKKWAINLGLGLIILLEVEAAALSFVGSIWLIGKILGDMKNAWQPVIDNGDYVLAALGFGTIIIVGAGVLIGILGAAGKTLAISMGVGLIVLLEAIGAALLFLGAILKIGQMLNDIAEAWSTVYDNKDLILDSLEDGIAILAMVAAISGAIGLITVGTFGLINVAIGLGAATLLEIETTAILFFDAIQRIGIQLSRIAIIWGYVLQNKEAVQNGLEEGIKYLVLVAELSAKLGIANVKSGGTLKWAIDSGTTMLNEICDAAVHFYESIKQVGEILTDVGEIWRKVLEHKDDIEEGLNEGTKHLIRVAEIAGELGTAAVKSGGLLYLAIDLGTKMLKKLGDSTVDFVKNMKEVAEEFNNMSPVLKELNANLPELNENLKKYIEFMQEFAGYAKDYANSSNSAGFKGFVSRIIQFFTGNPIKKLADDVRKNGDYADYLNEQLVATNEELLVALDLLKNYFRILEVLDNMTNQNTSWNFNTNIFINMREVGEHLILGLADGIKANYWRVNDALDEIIRNALSWGRGYDYGWNFGNAIASGIGDAMRNANFPRLKGNVETSGEQVSLKFRAYASGGYPERGELFMANENGPELVGNIGNRTAVANNDQITEGIATATYQAMSRALAENQGDSSMTPYFDIRIGNDKVYEGYATYKNNESNMYGVVM